MIIIILSSITVISANDTNSTRNLNYNISSNDSYMMENNTSINFKQKIDNNIIKENTNNNMKYNKKNGTKTIKTSNTQSNSSNNNITYSYTSILKGANQTSNYIRTNHSIPATTIIDGKKVGMNDFLYLMCKSLNQTSSVTIDKQYTHITSAMGTNSDNTKIYKSEYLILANEIIKCYNINGRNPQRIITIDNQTMSFDDAIYFYVRAVAWKYNYNRLPNYGTVIALYNNDYSEEENAPITTTTQSFTINTTYTKLPDEKYELTLTPSETCTIYYTRNGTTPTTKDKIYTSPLTIYNSTWIQYYGVNKNNQKTPILSFGIYRPATTYITNKPQLTNNYEYKLTLASSHESKIYYTINGTKPTTKSTQYTNPLTINNYTILQYFSITKDNNKISPIYYYKNENPTPYVTVINNTEVRNNTQSIQIIGNKPGTIYYTRNGTIPTNKSLIHNPKNNMTLNVKTQVKTILEDKNKKQSTLLFYQAPQYIEPAIILLSSWWHWTGEGQALQIVDFSREYSNVYFTTDNSNPKTSNTTKNWEECKTDGYLIFKPGTILKYFTESSESDGIGFKSEVYTYNVPISKYEVPIINIINLTRKYSNGEQKVFIQMNQEYKEFPNYNYQFIRIEGNKRIEEPIIPYKHVLNNNTKLILSLNNKTVEYDTTNGQRTRMNYTYTMEIPYQQVVVYNNSFNINLTKNTIKNNLTNNKTYFFNASSNQLQIINNREIYEPGLILYKNNNNLYLKISNYVYGDINQVSIVKKLIKNHLIEMSTISNENQIDIINLYLPNLYYSMKTLSSTKKELQLHDININITFTSNNLKPEKKTEVLRAYILNENRIENIKTYLLCNKKITSLDMDLWLNKKSQYNTSTIKYACYGMMLTELSYVYYNGKFSEKFAKELNTTDYFHNNYQLLISTSEGENTYISSSYHIGVTIDSTYDKKYMYKLWTGFTASYLEKYCLELTGLNASSATYDLFKDLSENRNLYVKVRNGTLTLNTENNRNYTIIIYKNGGVGLYIHNVYYSLPNQTIIVNTSNYNKFIKTSNSADINETYYNSTSGGVIHRDQNQLCFINEHVDEIWIVSDTYNKKWLSMKEKIDIITKLGDSTGILTGLIQSRWNFNILSNPLFTVPSFVLLSYSSFVFIHTTDLWIRDNYINSSQWGKYHTHKNHFDSYDYVEIFNTSDPSRVDIVEIPYTIHGYDRNNAIYIPYEGEPRNLTVSETYTYFQNETV